MGAGGAGDGGGGGDLGGGATPAPGAALNTTPHELRLSWCVRSSSPLELPTLLPCCSSLTPPRASSGQNHCALSGERGDRTTGRRVCGAYEATATAAEAEEATEAAAVVPGVEAAAAAAARAKGGRALWAQLWERWWQARWERWWAQLWERTWGFG
jgi:hypothetical protein